MTKEEYRELGKELAKIDQKLIKMDYPTSYDPEKVMVKLKEETNEDRKEFWKGYLSHFD